MRDSLIDAKTRFHSREELSFAIRSKVKAKRYGGKWPIRFLWLKGGLVVDGTEIRNANIPVIHFLN